MNIHKFLGKEFDCEYCGKRHKIDVKFIEKGSTEKISEVVSRNFGEKIKILLLSDNITYNVAGERIKRSIEEKNNVIPVVLHPKNEKKVSAKEIYLKDIERENVEGAELIITVGTGTITDLGKLTGDKYKIPVLAFPTAASMNGYTSGVAAFIKEGVKYTIPVKPAYGVFMDYGIIKNAPLDLTKAGFADSFAKSFANADWKTSSIITGEDFCIYPYKIVSEAEKKYRDKGELIKKKDERLIENLMEGLNLGGISMLMAGKSSPASGGEHLISHFLDMYAHQYEREIFAYHGIQVASGIYISSLIYQELKNTSSKEIKEMIKNRKVNYSEKFEKMSGIFLSGKDLIKKEFEKKMKVLEIMREKLHKKWEEIKKEISDIIYSPEEIKTIFDKAGIPFLLKDIGVDEELISDDLSLSRFIRGRLTVLDIADETGILDKFTEKYIKGEV